MKSTLYVSQTNVVLSVVNENGKEVLRALSIRQLFGLINKPLKNSQKKVVGSYNAFQKRIKRGETAFYIGSTLVYVHEV